MLLQLFFSFFSSSSPSASKADAPHTFNWHIIKYTNLCLCAAPRRSRQSSRRRRRHRRMRSADNVIFFVCTCTRRFALLLQTTAAVAAACRVSGCRTSMLPILYSSILYVIYLSLSVSGWHDAMVLMLERSALC